MDALSDALNTTTATAGAGASRGREALSQTDFMEIMISELTNQDPLEPMDNQQFLNQMVQMQTLEATTQLNEGIQAMLLGQQIASAGSLIGRQISGEDVNGIQVSGTVQRVMIQDGQTLLGLEDRLLPMSAVTEIHANAATASEFASA